MLVIKPPPSHESINSENFYNKILHFWRKRRTTKKKVHLEYYGSTYKAPNHLAMPGTARWSSALLVIKPPTIPRIHKIGEILKQKPHFGRRRHTTKKKVHLEYYGSTYKAPNHLAMPGTARWSSALLVIKPPTLPRIHKFGEILKILHFWPKGRTKKKSACWVLMINI